MMKVNVDQAKSYVYYDFERYISLGILKQLVWALSFISVFALACALLGKALPWSIAVLVLNLMYAFGVFVFQRKCNSINSFSLRFYINGMVASVILVYFLLLTYCCLALKNSPTIAYVLIFTCCLVIVLLYNGITILNIKNDKYLNTQKQLKKKYKAVPVFIGALVGVHFATILCRTSYNDIYLDIGIFCMSIVSLLSSLGTVNFLKYHYCKKFSISCDKYGNNTSELLTQYNQKKKRTSKILSAFVAIGIVAFAVFVIIGIVVSK